VAADADAPSFLLVTCQLGAEPALKAEVKRLWPAFRFAYSRPGFLTFKLPASMPLADDFQLDCVFARASACSLGKISVPELDARARAVWQLAGSEVFDALHVWQRDMAKPGWRGFEPHITPAALQAEIAIRKAWPRGEGVQAAPHPRLAAKGARVLDCVLVEADEWWVGWHRATTVETRHPGGLIELTVPQDIVSRAYVKMGEALAWSGLPVERGQKIAELGCAPGGASQALLDRGLSVMGIDPAQVDERVLAHRSFAHVRKRADDVRRREFRGVHWLAADMNVAPTSTLDAVETIVTHASVSIRGLLLTLKLLDWKMADEIPQYVERIRGWGFGDVRARQLAHNRQEICVTALRKTKRRKRTTVGAGRRRKPRA
jgi:23S rRNA (cytidine2498-2'-O)-methyltransferase